MLLTRLLPTRINQFSEICGTDQPRRFLTTQPERPARQLLRGCPALGFRAAQPEVLRRNAIQRNVGFAEFRQQTEVCAVQNVDSRNFSNAPTLLRQASTLKRWFRGQFGAYLPVTLVYSSRFAKIVQQNPNMVDSIYDFRSFM